MNEDEEKREAADFKDEYFSDEEEGKNFDKAAKDWAKLTKKNEGLNLIKWKSTEVSKKNGCVEKLKKCADCLFDWDSSHPDTTFKVYGDPKTLHKVDLFTKRKIQKESEEKNVY